MTDQHCPTCLAGFRFVDGYLCPHDGANLVVGAPPSTEPAAPALSAPSPSPCPPTPASAGATTLDPATERTVTILGRSLRITSGRGLLVGRENTDTDDLLSERGNISRRHCLLEVRDGHLWVTDLGSLNQTFVDEVAIPDGTPVPLSDGSSLRLAADLDVTLDGGQ